MAKEPKAQPKAADVTPQMGVQRAFSWDYSVHGGAPAAGFAYQKTSTLDQIAINAIDKSSNDNTGFMNTIVVGDGISVNGGLWTVTSTALAAGVFTFGIKPPQSFAPFGVETITFIPKNTLSTFPTFTPIVPPPAIGVGGGNPPNFPPPTPPPIGAIPPGVLVGPVVAAAGVPPSVAGNALIIYKTGSATSPTAASWIPQFTTTFPIPTIVFSNIYTGGKPPVTPPNTASTLCIVLNGWGPNTPPNLPTSPGSDGRLPRSLSGLMAMEAEKANGNGKKRKAV